MQTVPCNNLTENLFENKDCGERGGTKAQWDEPWAQGLLLFVNTFHHFVPRKSHCFSSNRLSISSGASLGVPSQLAQTNELSKTRMYRTLGSTVLSRFLGHQFQFVLVFMYKWVSSKHRCGSHSCRITSFHKQVSPCWAFSELAAYYLFVNEQLRGPMSPVLWLQGLSLSSGFRFSNSQNGFFFFLKKWNGCCWRGRKKKLIQLILRHRCGSEEKPTKGPCKQR